MVLLASLKKPESDAVSVPVTVPVTTGVRSFTHTQPTAVPVPVTQTVTTPFTSTVVSPSRTPLFTQASPVQARNTVQTTNPVPVVKPTPVTSKVPQAACDYTINIDTANFGMVFADGMLPNGLGCILLRSITNSTTDQPMLAVGDIVVTVNGQPLQTSITGDVFEDNLLLGEYGDDAVLGFNKPQHFVTVPTAIPGFELMDGRLVNGDSCIVVKSIEDSMLMSSLAVGDVLSTVNNRRVAGKYSNAEDVEAAFIGGQFGDEAVLGFNKPFGSVLPVPQSTTILPPPPISVPKLPPVSLPTVVPVPKPIVVSTTHHHDSSYTASQHSRVQPATAHGTRTGSNGSVPTTTTLRTQATATATQFVTVSLPVQQFGLTLRDVTSGTEKRIVVSGIT